MAHKSKLALLKYWENLWEHKFKRSPQTPSLSWASESTWSPWGKGLWWLSLQKWWLPCSQGGNRRTLPRFSPPTKSGHRTDPHHTTICTSLCPGARELSCTGAGRGCPPRTMPLPVWSDRNREEMLTTPETDHQNSLDGLQLSQLP